MKTKMIGLSVAAFLVLGTFAHPAQAQAAPPPFGLWKAVFKDGSTLTVNISPNRTFLYHPSGAAPVTGNWCWSPTSTGGIITMTYPTVLGPRNLYYSVTWVSPNQIVWSDPYFRVIMIRQ